MSAKTKVCDDPDWSIYRFVTTQGRHNAYLNPNSGTNFPFTSSISDSYAHAA